MRLSCLVLVPLLAGCAGNVADYIGPRSSIIAPQLTRYGFDAAQTQCVAGKLGSTLTPLQLRRMVRLASAVRKGFFEPPKLTLRDLRHVATTMSDPQIRLELDRATDACGMSPVVPVPPLVEPAPPVIPTTPAAPAWRNLGAAETGQSIEVDSSSLEQSETGRTGWFRLINPGPAVPNGVSYRLRVDCPGRTIQSLAHRRQDEAGTVTEFREYRLDEEGPIPVEAGTVMEIAHRALCA